MAARSRVSILGFDDLAAYLFEQLLRLLGLQLDRVEFSGGSKLQLHLVAAPPDAALEGLL